MIAAIYARKSNEQEKGTSGASESVERQIDHAKAFATAKGFTLRANLIFHDDAVSGAVYTKLAGRRQMVAAAEAGKFQVLVVSEQSRLGRDMIEVAYTIKMIAECGVRVFAYLDDSEISVTGDQALMTILRGYGSQSERANTGRRVYDAALRRVNAGQVAGAKVYGYDNVAVTGPSGKKSHVERRINPEQAAVVVRIFTMYAEGPGSVKIARLLNADHVPSPRPRGWSQTTVRGVLRNPLYRGDVLWGRIKSVVRRGKDYNQPRPESEWHRREDPALRIVPEPLWQTVQARREGRRRAFPRSPRTGQLLGRPNWHDGQSNYLMTGFACCSFCGGSVRATHRVMGSAANRVTLRAYTCAVNDNLGTVKCPNNVIVRHELLDRAVLTAICGVLDDDLLNTAMDRALARLQQEHSGQLDRRSQVERELAAVQQRIDRLVDALEDGSMPVDELRPRLASQRERKQALTTEHEALAEAGTLASLDPERVKSDLRRYAADVRVLLAENIQQGRLMLRKLLAGPIECEPVRAPGGKGWRFRGHVTLRRLVAGEVATLATPAGGSLTDSARSASYRSASLTGATEAGRCAGGRGPARCGSGCRASGGAWPRSGGA
jgi:site-specific DNA recombinase